MAEKRNKRNTTPIMSMEGSRNNKGRSMSRPYTSVMLVSIPSKMSVSGFMGYLKGKSALLIFQRWGNMKFAYRNSKYGVRDIT